MTGTDFFFVTIVAHHSSNSQTGMNRLNPEQERGWRLWLHSLKVAQLLRNAACLHTNQSRSYLNHLVHFCSVFQFQCVVKNNEYPKLTKNGWIWKTLVHAAINRLYRLHHNRTGNARTMKQGGKFALTMVAVEKQNYYILQVCLYFQITTNNMQRLLIFLFLQTL